MYDGSAQVNMETTQNSLCMAAFNRQQRLGPGCAALGAGAPWLARLATAFAKWAGG